jgi:hypothetical protein
MPDRQMRGLNPLSQEGRSPRSKEQIWAATVAALALILPDRPEETD